MVRSYCLLLALVFAALFAWQSPAVARTAPDPVTIRGGAFAECAARAATGPGPGIASAALAAAFLGGDRGKYDNRDGGAGWSQESGRDSDSYRDADHNGDHGGDYSGDYNGGRQGDRDHDRDRHARRNDHDRDHDHDGDHDGDGGDHAPKPVPEPSTLLSFAVAVLVGGGVLVSRRLLGSRK